MKKVKIFKDGRDIYTKCYMRADEKVNEFLEENKGKIEFVDVSFATNLNGFGEVVNSIMLTYEIGEMIQSFFNYEEYKKVLKDYIRYCVGQFMIYGKTYNLDNLKDRFYGLRKGNTYYLFKSDFEEYLKKCNYSLKDILEGLYQSGVLIPTIKDNVVERYYKKVSIMNKKMWCYVVDIPEEEE